MDDIETLVEKIQTKAFWAEFAPGLSISDAPKATQPLPRNAERDAAFRARLIEEGYLRISDIDWRPPVADMARAMMDLTKLGLPPAFVGVYDAPWMMAAQMRGLMDHLLSPSAQLVPDFWAWVVRPGQAGFNPHRDRITGALDKRGHPITLTVWAPLTPAGPDNGGIYLLPANFDPLYRGESRDLQYNLHDVRAVPSDPGDLLIWTGRAVHWGGRSSRFSQMPRLSIAWEFQAASADPLEGFVMESYPNIPFETRLGLLARQMVFYQNRQSGGYLWERIIEVFSERFPLPFSTDGVKHAPATLIV